MQAIDGSLIFQVLADGSIFGGDYDGRLGPLTNWINNNSRVFAGKTVLDLGSNAGHFPIEYVRAGAKKVIAVEGRAEFQEQWIRITGNKPTVEWHTCDVREYQPKERVDVISCLGLLYHVEGFLPRLREMAEDAEAVLIEVQTSASKNENALEHACDRTQSMKIERVLHATPDGWERIIYKHFGKSFHMSRIWLLCYGDVYKVKESDGNRIGYEFHTTLRAFYLLHKKWSNVEFYVDSKTGCDDVTDQPVRPIGSFHGTME